MPAIFWDIDCSGMGFTVEYNLNGGGGWVNAGQIYFAADSERNFMGVATSDGFAAWLVDELNTLIDASAGAGTASFAVEEIQTADDAFLLGGMPARRLLIYETYGSAGSYTSFRLTSSVSSSITVDGLWQIFGQDNGSVKTSSVQTTSTGSKEAILCPLGYDGAFFVPDFYDHDWRDYQKQISGITVSQNQVVSVLRRAKVPERNFKWQVVPAAYVRLSARFDSGIATAAGVVQAGVSNNKGDKFVPFENFWESCIARGKAFLFAPEYDVTSFGDTQIDYDTCTVTRVEHINDFESMLASRLGDMAVDCFDIEFRATVTASQREVQT